MKHLFSELLQTDVVNLTRLKAGRNSRVWRLDLSDGTRVAGKQYVNHADDQRDRLGVEWKALRFLSENNVHVVPKPIAHNSSRNIAAYSLLAGEPTKPGTINEDDVRQLVEYLICLVDLSGQCKEKYNEHFLPASEACLEVGDFQKIVVQRLNRLKKQGIGRESLFSFLQHEFIPVFEMASKRFWKEMPEHKCKKLMLSPSDVGFHNAVRDGNGFWGFVDFEFFGWDDPAKLICDTLLHPGSHIPHALKSLFLNLLVEQLDGEIYERVTAAHTMTALKWCLILLNEFIPNHWQRRRFSAIEQPEKAMMLENQLNKSRNMLQTIIQTNGSMPYA